jgi:hypothetical protein
MKNLTKIVATIALTAVALTGCSNNSAYEERKQKQEQSVINGGEGLEVKNLKEKAKRENDPNATRYVYLWVPGDATPIGYYVIKGKVSSSGSQVGPESEIVDPCPADYCPTVVDSSKDDGSFGAGDPGIFFFLANGTMTDTNVLYLSTDAPLKIDAPLLGEVDNRK